MKPATISLRPGSEAASHGHSRTAHLKHWPALLRRYRDLASLRHDYPLILVEKGAGQGIQSLSAVINELLKRIAPRGAEGEKTRLHVLRLEKEIRSLVLQNKTGLLSKLWSQAAGKLASRGGLSAHEKELLEQDLERAAGALDMEGEVIGCDAETGDRVMRHLWSRTYNVRVGRIRQQLRQLAIRVNDLLRSDDLASPEAREPESLKRAFGGRFGEMIDFASMSKTLRGVRAHGRMPARRRERIEWTLRVLREEKFFGVKADTDRYDFTSCTEALAEFKDRLPRMAELVKAIRIAVLEMEGRYREALHDEFFAHFSAGSLTVEDIHWFPGYFVSIRERDCDAADRANLMEILSSDLPIKLLFQVDHIFHDADGQPDILNTTAWPIELATMAANLGNQFVLQTATSSLCPMAERLANGLEAPGFALFCVFSPGSESYPGLPPYLAAAAAAESRLFPAFVFDPAKGGTWAECFSLDGNPQPEHAWPAHAFVYEDETMQVLKEELSFTAVDFLAADSAFGGAFHPVQRSQWTDEMVPLVQYLQAGATENVGRTPFVLVVGSDDRLQRAVVTPAAVQLARRIRRRWHSLQELGGIDNSYAGRALEAAARAPQTEPAAEPPPVSTAPEPSGKAEKNEVSSLDAWIETARCTSCNECTTRNNRMFKYNENKQACIADLKAGTYRELVEAAEGCMMSIIHPGEPWNSSEPDLDGLLQRAELLR